MPMNPNVLPERYKLTIERARELRAKDREQERDRESHLKKKERERSMERKIEREKEREREKKREEKVRETTSDLVIVRHEAFANTLQHTATLYNTLQHSATHCCGRPWDYIIT